MVNEIYSIDVIYSWLILCRANHHKCKMPRDKTETNISITVQNLFIRDTSIGKGRGEMNGFSKYNKGWGICSASDKDSLIHIPVILVSISLVSKL